MTITFRWGPCDLSRRGSARALPRHDARAGGREQRRAAVHGVRKDEKLGFRAPAAEARQARPRVDDGRRQAGKDSSGARRVRACPPKTA